MKKQKFLTLFSILALCICSLFIGVWAAKTATVTTGGSINFTATGVNCKVSGAIQNSTASLKTLETLTFSASDSTDTKSWGTSNAIAFDNNETPINIVITVENLVDRALYAQVTNAVFGDGQFDVTLSTELLELSTAGTGTITITITPKPMDVSVTKDYSFNVVLTAIKPAVTPDESEYPNLTFTKLTGQTVDGLQAVSVKENTSSLPTGDLVLPSYVTVDGVKCIVTTIPTNAFATSTGLTSLTIPETITSMGMGILSGDEKTYYFPIYVNSAYVAGLGDPGTYTAAPPNTDRAHTVTVYNHYFRSKLWFDYDDWSDNGFSSIRKVYVKSDLAVGAWATAVGTKQGYDIWYNMGTEQVDGVSYKVYTEAVQSGLTKEY